MGTNVLRLMRIQRRRSENIALFAVYISGPSNGWATRERSDRVHLVYIYIYIYIYSRMEVGARLGAYSIVHGGGDKSLKIKSEMKGEIKRARAVLIGQKVYDIASVARYDLMTLPLHSDEVVLFLNKGFAFVLFLLQNFIDFSLFFKRIGFL